MENNTFEDLLLINIDDKPASEKSKLKRTQNVRFTSLPYIDFELFVNENYHNKIQILNPETFNQIKEPIIIFFNHFREKCAYHIKWLNTLYELALQYGERIKFIAADMSEIDVIYPGRNPINFFCRSVDPGQENPHAYAIDEKKRIQKCLVAFETMNGLRVLCENLINSNMFPSQLLPENNELNLIKICVQDNFEELIMKSTKNIFLIINIERYRAIEPNMENIALTLKKFNLDIVYMDAEKNYIPFEYDVNGYPSLIFIPYNDKKNFIHYKGSKQQEVLMEFLQKILKEPEFLLLKQQEMKSKFLKNYIQVTEDFQLDFKDLPQFLQDKFNNKFVLLDREILLKYQRFNIVIFMDFVNMKCQYHHVQWLNKIYQAIETDYVTQYYFVADFKDIDVINSKWKPNDLIKSSQGKPKIYAFGYGKHTYEYENFVSIPSLFYFIFNTQNGCYFHSQVYSKKRYRHDLVKVWTANYINHSLNKCKKHVFITFYCSNEENTNKLLNLLNTIALDVKQLNIKVVKFDVKLNHVDLEYVYHCYPIHYFIPKSNKRDIKLYEDKDLNRIKMLEFIKHNLSEN